VLGITETIGWQQTLEETIDALVEIEKARQARLEFGPDGGEVLDGLLPREDAAVNEELYGYGKPLAKLDCTPAKEVLGITETIGWQQTLEETIDGRCCSPIYVVYANEDT
jgi:hypothetical protein